MKDHDWINWKDELFWKVYAEIIQRKDLPFQFNMQTHPASMLRGHAIVCVSRRVMLVLDDPIESAIEHLYIRARQASEENNVPWYSVYISLFDVFEKKADPGIVWVRYALKVIPAEEEGE